MTRTAVSFALFLTLALMSCSDSKPTATAAQSLPSVTVAHPLHKTITEWDEYTGRFAAVATVEVRSRVSGFINSIHFKDGQLIKQGDLLFVIDPRPYALAVEQGKGDGGRAQAKLQVDAFDVDRATPVARRKTLTAREFDARKSTQRDAAGPVA